MIVGDLAFGLADLTCLGFYLERLVCCELC